MIEIFKTNVANSIEAERLLKLLNYNIQQAEVNFDLEDCDSVLRVKGEQFCPFNIIKLLIDCGFECRILE